MLPNGVSSFYIKLPERFGLLAPGRLFENASLDSDKLATGDEPAKGAREVIAGRVGVHRFAQHLQDVTKLSLLALAEVENAFLAG